MKKKKVIKVPEGCKEILLHACCAPCATAIVEWMKAQDLRPTIFFYNPNIYPYEEYVKRRDESKRHAETNGLNWAEGEWDHDEWKETVKGHEKDPERAGRCQLCFNMRMNRAAHMAEELHLPFFTTTLASSRWKSLTQVNEAGKIAETQITESKHWAQNWRICGLQERRNALIKEGHFYNQLYCGCEYSIRTGRDSGISLEELTK